MLVPSSNVRAHVTILDADLISLLPRAPERRSTAEVLSRLRAAGHILTPRSLQRRLQSLALKYPITCDDHSKPYGWCIARDAPPTLGEMSVQEAVALKLAQRHLQELMPPDVLADLTHYFARADEKLKAGSLYRAWLEKVRVLPSSQPLEKPKLKRALVATAYAGVLKGHRLTVSYRAKGASQSKSYEISPLALVVRGSVTYLVARFPWYEEPTTMALHRFEQIRDTNFEMEHTHGFNLDEFIATGEFGFLPTRPKRVQIRFYGHAGKHLDETPLTPDQTLKHLEDGESLLAAHLPITEQLKWWVLGFGELAEVVSPQDLRNEIADRLQTAITRYRKRT